MQVLLSELALFSLVGRFAFAFLPSSLRMLFFSVSVHSVPAARRPAFGASLSTSEGLLLLAFSLPYSLAPVDSVTQLSNGYYGGAKTPSLSCPDSHVFGLSTEFHCARAAILCARPRRHVDGVNLAVGIPVAAFSGRFPLWDRVGSPVFPGFPSCSDAGFSDPATARHTSPINGALVSSPVIPVTRHRPKFKDAMKRRRFRGSMAGFELTAYASCRPLGEHPSPSDFGDTTTQGSLPVERLHSLPPGIGTRSGTDETFLQ